MKRTLPLLMCGLCFLAGCVLSGCTGSNTVTVSFASPSQAIDNGQSVTITVTIKDAKNAGVTWTISGPGTLSNQSATSVNYTAAASGGGTAMVTATSKTNIKVSATVTITVTAAPAITTTTLPGGVVGTAYNATVAVTGGAGTLTYSVNTGALPAGLSLNTGTGAITGTPTAVGKSNFTVKVTDSSVGGSQSATSPALSITVNQAPAITSANNVTFVVGSTGTFTVTATGTPTPSLTATGVLPTGVNFKDNGNGTATLSGTPAPGTAANYAISFTASNGVGTAATQSFTLTVGQPAAITSANSTTFTVGTSGTFTVTTTGFPAPALTESGGLPSGVTFTDNGNGTGKLSGTPAAGTGGTYPVTIKTHNGIGTDFTQNFVLTVNETPAITSANKTTFTVSTPGTFTVTTSGFPTPSIAESGALPTGVTFVDNHNGTGTLAGIPASGTAGNYPITFTPSNGVGSPVAQSFTLTVGQPPAITSTNSATFTVGTSGTFTVTATGFPAPTFSETGALPTGVTFNATTGVLSGTPAAGTGKAYSITFTASNGAGTPASQPFTLTVDQAPAITSANSATFSVGAAGTFTVTTTGFPAPSLVESGTLPGGVTFNTSTGVLSGTPALGTAGTYPITFTATNGVGSPASQPFTLTVNTAPVITSVNKTTFTVGTNGSFAVTATGTPIPTLSETGTLPAGVTFNPGTGVLSGTPAAGTGGTYSITFTANNGVGTPASQPFTLTVDQAPAITSPNSTTFTVGTLGSFTVMTTGFPAPSLVETGALPGGVTFTDNGNGTGKLSGTPAAGSVGTYTITFTASNGVGTPATQTFTLTVNTAPVVTSGSSTTFTVGTPGTFTVTTTGAPAPALTETGALPGGVTFTDHGNGTATLGGTPAAATGGTYAIMIKATSSSGSTTQNFTLTVDQAPAITSANSTTFSVGTNGSFTVTTTGFPLDPITETGALPSGVTFVDNGNNTATLSGTPAAGTAGTYSITITASNGVLPNATQIFTLTVSAVGIACGSGHESVFKGQYAFLFQGFDASGPVAIGGVFSADGTGKIALLVGVMDINVGAGVQTNVAIDSVGSSFSVGADNRGCLTIATGSVTFKYAISLGSLNGSNIATKGRMIEVDNSGTLGSGVLRLQDSAAFTTSAFVGNNYAFGAASTLTLSTAGANRFAVLGSVTVNSSSSITGEEDFNFSGQVDGGSTTGAAVAITGGSLSVAANGRGTFSLIVGASGSFPGGTFNFSAYVVSATEFLFMNIGAQSQTNPLFAGSALKQSGGFSLSSLNANMVLYSTGICSTCGSGGGPGPQLTIGVVTIPSAGNFSFTADQNSGGVLTSGFTFVGTYTVDSAGRVLITRTGHTIPGLAVYLVGPNQGFFGSTGTDVNIGFAEPQTGGPSFTNASLSGGASFGTTWKVTQNVSDNSGIANFDGANTVSGTSDQAKLGSAPKSNAFSQPYSVTNGTGTPGRGTITQSGAVNLIFYIISPSKVVLMDGQPVTSGGTSDPALIIGEK
jgi:hypothetical protein